MPIGGRLGKIVTRMGGKIVPAGLKFLSVSVYFDTGAIPVIMGLSNIAAKPGGQRSSPHPGPGSGYIAYCEGGRLEGQRGRAVAFDRAGNVVRKFVGDSGKNHQRNFIDAVRQHDPKLLNADVAVGNASTGWCNLANIAFQAGAAYSGARARQIAPRSQPWTELLDEMAQLLAAHGIDLNDSGIRLSHVLQFEPNSGRFIGPHAATANSYLKRQYRPPFVVPEITGR